MDCTLIQWVGYVVGIISSAVAIISTIYGMKKKKELSKLQGKTEKAKTKKENAKTKLIVAQTETEKLKGVEHASAAVKNFLDWFRKH